MKSIYNFLFLYIVCGTASFGNPVRETEKDTILSQMKTLGKNFTKGIFERIIEQAEIQKAHTLNSKNTFAPYTEIHKLYYRFHDFDTTVQVSKDRSYYYIIGKVFVSERYRELDYRTEHRNRDAFEKDNDGFFYYCKLYYHEQTRDFRLIVYPGFVQNICAPYMHFNKKTCPKHALVKYPEDSLSVIKATPYSVHETSIRTIIEIQDALSEDFLVNNAQSRQEKLNGTTKFVEDMKEKHRKKNQQYNLNYQDWGPRDSRPYWSNSGFDWVNTVILNLFIFKNNTLNVSLNLSKQMKVFKIDMQEGIPKSLMLTATKNANNEDFSTKSKYELSYHPFASIVPLPSETFIQSEDKGIINLVTSSFPNDKYLTGKNWAYRRFPFVKTGVASIDTCMGHPDFEGCIQKAHDRLKKASDEKSAEITLVNNSISAQRKKLSQIERDTIRIAQKTDSLKSVLLTNDTMLKTLRKPFDEVGLNTYLDSMLVSGNFSGFLNLQSLKDAIPRLAEIKSKMDQVDKVIPVPNLYREVKALLESWIANPTPVARLADSPYHVKLSDTFFTKSVKTDMLVNDKLHLTYDNGDLETVSKSDFLAGLTNTIEKDNEFNTWKQNMLAKLAKIGETTKQNDILNTNRRDYATSLNGNRLTLKKEKVKGDSLDLSLQSLNGGMENLKKGSDQMKLAQRFRKTFLPGQITKGKYFIYLENSTYDSLYTLLNKMNTEPNSKIFFKIRALSKVFKNSLYVRAGLPVLTDSILDNGKSNSELSRFIKHQVLEIYEPYDIDRLGIREKYKSRMTQEELDDHKGWKGAYYKTVFEMLAKQKFNSAQTYFELKTNKLSNGDSIFAASPNQNTVWTIQFDNVDYRWLQISEELFREIKYVNWFFNKYEKLKRKNKQIQFIRDLSKSV